MKDHWTIPADSVTITPSKNLYPAHLILSHHDYIEEIEIPNANYINVKINGKWTTIRLPSSKILSLKNILSLKKLFIKKIEYFLF